MTTRERTRQNDIVPMGSVAAMPSAEGSATLRQARALRQASQGIISERLSSNSRRFLAQGQQLSGQ